MEISKKTQIFLQVLLGAALVLLIGLPSFQSDNALLLRSLDQRAYNLLQDLVQAQDKHFSDHGEYLICNDEDGECVGKLLGFYADPKVTYDCELAEDGLDCFTAAIQFSECRYGYGKKYSFNSKDGFKESLDFESLELCIEEEVVDAE